MAAQEPLEEPRSWSSATVLGSFGSEKELGHLLAKPGGEKLVTAKDEYSCDAVSWAARNGRHNIVQLLASKEADLESRSFGGMRPLHHAVNSNEEPVIKELLGKAVDVNAADEAGNTPLHYACKR